MSFIDYKPLSGTLVLLPPHMALKDLYGLESCIWGFLQQAVLFTDGKTTLSDSPKVKKVNLGKQWQIGKVIHVFSIFLVLYFLTYFH